MLFRSKQREIEEQLATYREKAAECVEEFRKSFTRYCASSDLDQLREDVVRVHKAESEADDIRREVETTMYSKALFPESRGDVLGLLEALDRIPNQAEAVVRLIVNQYVSVPEEYHAQLQELVDVCCRCVDATLEASAKVLSDFANAASIVGRIDELESQADGIEAALLQRIFSSDLDTLGKMQMRELVQSIADISDRAENVGDRLRIIVAKRLV
jgi:uncharacterized protein